VQAYAKVSLLYRVTRPVASTYGRSMTNGANYKRRKLHHSPWHSDIRTSNQLNISSPASGIASTPTPLSGLGNLPTSIPNAEAHVIITNPQRTRATERNPRHRQWQLKLQSVSTSRTMVSGSRSIHRLGHSDMTCLVLATGRLLERYMRNRRQLMSARDLETVYHATQRVAKELGEGSHW